MSGELPAVLAENSFRLYSDLPVDNVKNSIVRLVLLPSPELVFLSGLTGSELCFHNVRQVGRQSVSQ